MVCNVIKQNCTVVDINIFGFLEGSNEVVDSRASPLPAYEL